MGDRTAAVGVTLRFLTGEIDGEDTSAAAEASVGVPSGDFVAALDPDELGDACSLALGVPARSRDGAAIPIPTLLRWSDSDEQTLNVIDVNRAARSNKCSSTMGPAEFA